VADRGPMNPEPRELGPEASAEPSSPAPAEPGAIPASSTKAEPTPAEYEAIPAPPAPAEHAAIPALPAAAPRGRGWSLAALLLALAGAAIAAYLVREHIRVTEGGLAKGFLCGGGGGFDCSQVASHASSWLLGLPVALWGLAFYIAAFGLALASLLLRPAERSAAVTLGVTLAGAALVFDAYLAWTMVTQIGAICLNCVATYGVNALLVLSFWRLDRTMDEPPDYASLLGSWRPLFPKLAIVAVAIAGIGAAAFFTWQPLHDIQSFAREETLDFLEQLRHPPEIDMTRFGGRPARGPATAPLTIVVAGDFQCSFCRALAAHVESLRREHPDQIRVVFVNAPVNSDCNPAIKAGREHADACWLAEVGACAAEQGKFWQYHDYVFHTLPHPQVTRALLERRLTRIGLDPARVESCLASGAARAAVARDIALCNELKLTGVPSVVINGYPRRAGVYPQMLRSVVHAMLRNL